jgi:hypothetical protein
MNSYQASPGAEVSGSVVLSMVNVMGAFQSVALRILAKNGIVDPKADRWYSHQAFLNSFKTLIEEVGPNTVAQIGRQIAMQGQGTIPPEIKTPEQALQALDIAYYSQHRGGEIGHYTFISTGERSGTVISTTPNQSDFDRGLLSALVEQLAPPGSLVEVVLDPKAESRTRGGKSCTYLISW